MDKEEFISTTHDNIAIWFDKILHTYIKVMQP